MNFRTAFTALALSAIAVGLLAVSGYIGGRMVFEHGVSVARLSKKKWRALAAAGHANLLPEQPKSEGAEA